MKKKKGICMLMAAVLAMAMLTGCSGKEKVTQDAQNKNGKINISFYNAFAGTDEQFQKIIEGFKEVRPDVTIEYIPSGGAGEELIKYQGLHAAKKAPSLATVDSQWARPYLEKFSTWDLEEDSWLKDAYPDSLSPVTTEKEGIFGVPFTMQGHCLIYNVRAVEESIGGVFDPASIKTRTDLENLFDKIEKAGKTAPVMYHGADWYLGETILGMVYTTQGTSLEENKQFVERLKNSEAAFEDNTTFQYVMDTFDLMSKYNLYKEDPLGINDGQAALDFATGKAAFYYRGDGFWGQIAAVEGKDDEYGVMPLPVSEDENDLLNNKIGIQYFGAYVVDKADNNEEQQRAAKDFIKYIITSDLGQEQVIDGIGYTIPFKKARENKNPLSQGVKKYYEEGKGYPRDILLYLPSDYWSKTGECMQKYISGVSDRTQLAKELDAYWVAQK